MTLALLLLVTLVVPATAAYGKGGKGNFLKAYPGFFKFLLFWWCVLMFIVMGILVGDHVLFLRKGPCWVHWYADYVFKGGEREEYWKQFVDPSSWSWTHPVLMSADIKLVETLSEPDPAAVAAAAAKNGTKEEGGEEDEEEEETTDPSAEVPAQSSDDLSEARKARIRPVPLGPMRPGLALVLRHKSSTPLPIKHDADPETAGKFFCMRECVESEKPADGCWRFVMRTIDVGVGYPFLPGTEEVEVVLHPSGDDGSIRCEMNCKAALQSRLFAWWNNVKRNSTAGCGAMLGAIASEVEGSKKRD